MKYRVFRSKRFRKSLKKMIRRVYATGDAPVAY